MNNRNVSNTPIQLSFNFGGGGVTTGFVRHGKDSNISFNDVVSIEALFAAWEKFRRGKRARYDVQFYERNVEENIFELHERLLTGQYLHGRYEPFTIHDPKHRLIHKATVNDRLLHQAIVSAIEPSFERQFIYDSYSCRIGKGSHMAVSRLQTFLRRASRNNTRTVYALKCDVKQFFATMDHEILRQMLEVHVQDPGVLRLLGEVIGSLSGDLGKGIPLGNITSQLFANIYLHELDWFMKQTLKEEHYLRYCDDFIIVGTSREHLESLVQPISDFLEERLKLSLHPDKITIRTWYQGIDFLGYVTKPHCVLLRHKTKQRMLEKSSPTNITSYLGLCSHADTFEIQQILQLKVWGVAKANVVLDRSAG